MLGVSVRGLLCCFSDRVVSSFNLFVDVTTPRQKAFFQWMTSISFSKTTARFDSPECKNLTPTPQPRAYDTSYNMYHSIVVITSTPSTCTPYERVHVAISYCSIRYSIGPRCMSRSHVFKFLSTSCSIVLCLTFSIATGRLLSS